MDRHQIAEEVLAAVGGKDNVAANDICMTRLRIRTNDPKLVDSNKLAQARGVLGFVHRGANALEIVFGPGKVQAVHEALVELTGSAPDESAFVDVKPAVAAPINVQITTNPLRNAAVAQHDAYVREHESEAPDADTVEDLVSLLSDIDASEEAAEELGADEPALVPDDLEHAFGTDRPARVLVINGPNINMLGIREPAIYGHDTYQTLLKTCHRAAKDAGFAECSCFQSNHEGDLIDAIQDAYDAYDGIVINPGAYTHTSIAILDAAKAVGLPMVEVHISKVDEREEFRQVSYIRAACFETVTGLGIEGYRKAIFDLANRLGIKA